MHFDKILKNIRILQPKMNWVIIGCKKEQKLTFCNFPPKFDVFGLFWMLYIVIFILDH